MTPPAIALTPWTAAKAPSAVARFGTRSADDGFDGGVRDADDGTPEHHPDGGTAGDIREHEAGTATKPGVAPAEPRRTDRSSGGRLASVTAAQERARPEGDTQPDDRHSSERF